MTDAKKLTAGQKFLVLLNESADSKDALLNLASSVIKVSHSKRDLKSRGLPETEAAVKMRSALARAHAITNRDVSTDDMLVMISHTYNSKGFGSPTKFNEDFKKKFPEQYNAASVSNNYSLQQTTSPATLQM